jgi:mRNA-degrading endonuclease RelE of RelBE toxin-antitoxin system
MRIEVSGQVEDFIRRQAPESRRRLRLALRGLEKGRGDQRPLEGPLSGYRRLRVGAFRVIFIHATDPKRTPVIRCLFAERRGVVYEVLEHVLLRELQGS